MEIWGAIAAVVLVVTVLAMVVERRRGGATGASRSLDFNASNREKSQHDGRFNGPTWGTGGGDGGGGT